MGTLATTLVMLPLWDSQSQGIVERRNGYFETSFMPGRNFTTPDDINVQFTKWLSRADARVVITTRAAPRERLEADLAEMRELTPRPLHLGWHQRVRLPCDDYVSLEGRLVAEHVRV